MSQQPQKTSAIHSVKSSQEDLFNTAEKLESTHTSELVIALCGPIGSPLHNVGTTLQKSLVDDFNYDKCEIIRLSDFIKSYANINSEGLSRFDKIKALINGGDTLRERHGSSILAELAIHQITTDREQHAVKEGHTHPKPRRVCHIIDSIKNQEELDVLRVVYREMLYSVGIFSPLSNRQKAMEKEGMSAAEIFQLIDQDSGEEFDHGQTVSDTFPQSDFFLRFDSANRAQLEKKVKRFLDLILGTKVITPTASETAMYMAASAATNSGCLSRQVGASLTDNEGSILSVGWNDVPKRGGGLYITTDTDEHDQRCWNNTGSCANDSEKDTIAREIATELTKKGYIKEGSQTEVASALRKNGKLKGLIEFSRAVHAEMHAIITAGRTNGGRISEGKLYCTTYPCHSCARHIISAGISEVYYIEPYPKSLAIRLHGDAITEDESDTSKVRILPYEGVAPSRYLGLFKMAPDSRKNKSDGTLKECKRADAEPKISKTLEALPALESLVVQGLKAKRIIDLGENDGQP